MSENYKPGDIAMVMRYGIERKVFRTDDATRPWITEECQHLLEHDVTDVRPLVVLDLAAANTYITEAEVAAAAIETLRASDNISDSGLADQIEAQTRPPKPAEPTGLGAVVEDEDGTILTRGATETPYPWIASTGSRWTWEQIDLARIISEGVDR